MRAGRPRRTAVTERHSHDDVTKSAAAASAFDRDAAIQKVRLARTPGTLVTRQESRPF